MQSHRSNRRRHAGLMFIVSLVLAAAAMRPTCAVADGALAVALPDDVVKKGFAYGYVTDYPDADKADAQALKKCRDTTIAGRSAAVRGDPGLQESVRRRRHGPAGRNAGRRLVRGAGLAHGGGSGLVEVRKHRRSRPPRRMRGRSFVV